MVIKRVAPPEWQDAYAEYVKLTPRGQRMIDQVVDKIYAQLKKEANSVDDLVGLYMESSKSILKKAFPNTSPEDLCSYETNLVERMAYWKRFTDVRPYEQTRSEILFSRK